MSASSACPISTCSPPSRVSSMSSARSRDSHCPERLSSAATATRQRMAHWETLATDEGALFDRSHRFDAGEFAPTVTWGISPEDVAPITGRVPHPDSFSDPAKREAAIRALDYIGLEPGQRLQDVAIEHI